MHRLTGGDWKRVRNQRKPRQPPTLLDRSQLPQLMSRPVSASRGWVPRAQARSTSPIWRGFSVVTGFFGCGRDGAAGDAGECGHAEVDGLFLALQGRVDLGELVLGADEADLESLDLAEPAFAFGLGDAVVQG
jgi:hypothetical protein